jgi:hypothetical protein
MLENIMKKWMIGAGIIAIVAVPALGFGPGMGGHEPKGPETRAEAEAKVKAEFAEIDANKDGVITREEADAFKTAHKNEMRDERFAKLDADKNGQISRDEYGAPRERQAGEGRGHGMRGNRMMGHNDLFAMADSNKDGKVTLVEATSKRLEVFDKADANKDGTVTPEERRTAWKSWFKERRNSGA